MGITNLLREIEFVLSISHLVSAEDLTKNCSEDGLTTCHVSAETCFNGRAPKTAPNRLRRRSGASRHLGPRLPANHWSHGVWLGFITPQQLERVRATFCANGAGQPGRCHP